MRTHKGIPILEPCSADMPGLRPVRLVDVLIEKKIIPSKADAKRLAKSNAFLKLITEPGTSTFHTMLVDFNDIATGATFLLAACDVLVKGNDVTTSFIFDATFAQWAQAHSVSRTERPAA